MEFIIIIYIIIICSSLSMILTSNPVYGLKFLILIFLNFSFLLIYFNINYLGFIFIMVYVGAVTILFLFVVMMLDIKQSLIHSSNYLTIGFLFVLLLFFILFNIIHFNVTSLKQYELINNFYFFKYHQNYISNINILGILLFNYYFITLLLVGLILLVATIGSIYLTYTTESIAIKKQMTQFDRTSNIYLS